MARKALARRGKFPAAQLQGSGVLSAGPGSEKFFLPRVLAMRNEEDALIGVAVALYDVTPIPAAGRRKNESGRHGEP